MDCGSDENTPCADDSEDGLGWETTEGQATGEDETQEEEIEGVDAEEFVDSVEEEGSEVVAREVDDTEGDDDWEERPASPPEVPEGFGGVVVGLLLGLWCFLLHCSPSGALVSWHALSASV